jgi:hypothetical protein
MIPVHVIVTTSGATGFQLISVTADEGDTVDMEGWTPASADTDGLLRARRLGSASRTYSLDYRATDDAGNVSTCTTTVTVPHDQGHDSVAVRQAGALGQDYGRHNGH